MQNQSARANHIKEGLEVEIGEGIDEPVALGAAELDQADLFKIAMKAVCLGVDGDALLAVEFFDKILERLLVSDQGSARNFSGEGISPAWRARGSRTWVVPSVGIVTNGPPASGAGSLNATPGISVVLPSRGKSFLSGW